VIDVLLYLFENYMDDGQELDPDQEYLIDELTQAGFPRGEVQKAFNWLEDLSSLHDTEPVGIAAPSAAKALRSYAPEELEKLDVDCRGFLLLLEQRGLLEPLSRELVLDRVLALESEELNLEQLKWVVLMVLFNRPGHEHAYALLEDFVLGENEGRLQ